MTAEPQPQRQPQAQRASGLRFLRTVVLLACLGTVLNSVGVYVTWRLNHKSIVALCVFRTDLQQRVDAGNDFLAKHPGGFAGIPAKQVRVSIDNQQRTVTTLRSLSCPK